MITPQRVWYEGAAYHITARSNHHREYRWSSYIMFIGKKRKINKFRDSIKVFYEKK